MLGAVSRIPGGRERSDDEGTGQQMPIEEAEAPACPAWCTEDHDENGTIKDCLRTIPIQGDGLTAVIILERLATFGPDGVRVEPVAVRFELGDDCSSVADALLFADSLRRAVEIAGEVEARAA